MPKTRFDQYAKPKRPAPDYLKALILERMDALDIKSEAMSEALGISPNTWFARKKQPTAEWTLGELTKAAVFLGIDPEDFRAAIRYRV